MMPGANRPGSKVSQGLRDAFWLWSMQDGLKAAFDCIKAFSETDQTEDLKRFDMPTLIIHGDHDPIVPISDSALLSSRLVKDAILKVYHGAPTAAAATRSVPPAQAPCPARSGSDRARGCPARHGPGG